MIVDDWLHHNYYASFCAEVIPMKIPESSKEHWLCFTYTDEIINRNLFNAWVTRVNLVDEFEVLNAINE